MYAKAYKHTCDDVGKTIKRTKRKYVWEFGFELSEYDVERHQVILFYSVISGKRQLVVDGQKISTSKGQYGKYEMKFNIDKRQNTCIIKADSDSSTLYVNNIEFNKLYSQGQLISNKQLQEHVYPIDSSDSDELNEDAINHLNLKDERYRNVESKMRGKGNPQLFDGPIAKVDINRESIPQERYIKTGFQSFGFDTIKQESAPQTKNSTSEQDTAQQLKKPNQPQNNGDPFSGFNFTSWVSSNDSSPQKSQSLSQNINTTNLPNTEITRSASFIVNPNQTQNQMRQSSSECPFFGSSQKQFQTLAKSHSQNEKKENPNQAFDDFFNQNSNNNNNQNAEDNRQTFQYNAINAQNSINDCQVRNSSYRNNSIVTSSSIQIHNNSIQSFNNQNQLPQFGQNNTNNSNTTNNGNNYNNNNFNIQQIQKDQFQKQQISQSNYNLL